MCPAKLFPATEVEQEDQDVGDEGGLGEMMVKMEMTLLKLEEAKKVLNLMIVWSTLKTCLDTVMRSCSKHLI